MTLTLAERFWIDRADPPPWATAWEWLARPMHYRAVRNLRLAAEDGDTERLASLLEPAVAVVIDTGSGSSSAKVVGGKHDAIAVLLFGLRHRPGRLVTEGSVNGQAGLVLSQNNTATAAIGVDFRGRLVSVVWIQLHPERLRHWNNVWPGA
jgi:hypothetical protein